jgi:hydroxyacylglutathione hydrolase
MNARLELEDTFGDIVRKACRGRGVSPHDVAARTGIAPKRLASFLDDQAQPTEAEAHAIAAVLGLAPSKLADIGLRRWYPAQQPLPDTLEHRVNRPHSSNGYFLFMHEQRLAAVVDPAGDPESIIKRLRQADANVRYFLLTHKHHDHADALAALRRVFPDAVPVISPADGAALGSAARDALAAEDGSRIPFGSVEVQVIATPGHTDGSCCFLFDGLLFTGDTLFSGSVGGLFGERHGYDDLLRSVKDKVLTLPPETRIFPGHGPFSTIGEERSHNPFFM